MKCDLRRLKHEPGSIAKAIVRPQKKTVLIIMVIIKIIIMMMIKVYIVQIPYYYARSHALHTYVHMIRSSDSGQFKWREYLQ